MQRFFVSSDNSIYSFTFWVEDVTIEGKVVGDLWSTGKFSTKTINWEAFIIVVVFKNAETSGNSFCILILLCMWIYIMERIWRRNSSIRQSEINGNLYPNFTSPKNVIKEGHSLFASEISNCKFTTV
jgi:hypothetical protein